MIIVGVANIVTRGIGFFLIDIFALLDIVSTILVVFILSVLIEGESICSSSEIKKSRQNFFAYLYLSTLQVIFPRVFLHTSIGNECAQK